MSKCVSTYHNSFEDSQQLAEKGELMQGAVSHTHIMGLFRGWLVTKDIYRLKFPVSGSGAQPENGKPKIGFSEQEVGDKQSYPQFKSHSLSQNSGL